MTVYLPFQSELTAWVGLRLQIAFRQGPQKIHYIGVICHFISSGWEKQQLMLYLGEITEEDTTENVITRLKHSCKHRLGIDFEDIFWSVCCDKMAGVFCPVKHSKHSDFPFTVVYSELILF
jgi:hypothetical protein